MWGDLESNQGHVDYKSTFRSNFHITMKHSRQFVKVIFLNTALPTELPPQNLPTFTSKKENSKI